MRSQRFAKLFWTARKSYIKISPQLYILAAIIILVLPLPWLLGWILAVIIHEFFHCIALCFVGKEIGCIQFGLQGAKIDTQAMSDWQTVFCALAGPVGGLFILSIRCIFPEAALCSLLLSVYNLIPISPLDGGRAFRAGMHMVLPEPVSEAVSEIIEKIALIVICLVSLFSSFAWKLGVMPLLFAILFVTRMCKIKIPCKSIFKAVQ